MQLRGGKAISGSLQSDEHFIVWMRTAAMPHFRKPWGIIQTKVRGEAEELEGLASPRLASPSPRGPQRPPLLSPATEGGDRCLLLR